MKTSIGIVSRGFSLALAFAMLLASANAQQPEKVARIGFLLLAHAPGNAQRASQRHCKTSAKSTARPSFTKSDTRTGTPSGCPSSQAS